METNGHKDFKAKYGIDYNTLIEISKKNDGGIYKQNYRVMYDHVSDRCFSLWSSPYRDPYIYIENEGFIIVDPHIRKSYDDVIKERFGKTINNSVPYE